MQTGPTFRLAQDCGEGLLSVGTREWEGYTTEAFGFRVLAGGPCGVVVRVQGLRRWYGLVFVQSEPGRRRGLALVKARDGKRTMLDYVPMDWAVDVPYNLSMVCHGRKLIGEACRTGMAETVIQVARADDDDVYESGGIGFVVTKGAVAVDKLIIKGV